MAKADSTRCTSPTDSGVDRLNASFTSLTRDLETLHCNLGTVRKLCGDVLANSDDEEMTALTHASTIILDQEHARCDRLLDQCMEAARNEPAAPATGNSGPALGREGLNNICDQAQKLEALLCAFHERYSDFSDTMSRDASLHAVTDELLSLSSLAHELSSRLARTAEGLK